MTITTTTDFDVIPQDEFVQPLMLKTPIKTILENCNWLYRNHQPPLLSVVYTAKEDIPREDQVFEFGTSPSVDGFVYRFQHTIHTTTVGQTMEVEVEEYYSAAWHTVYTQTATSVDDGTITFARDGAINALTTRLRFTFSAGASDYIPLSSLVRPYPDAAIAGIKASGFIPFDDGMINTAQTPIHTEILNRVKDNVVSIIGDRKVCVLSFAQHTNVAKALHDGEGHYIVGTSPNPTTMVIGHAKASMAGQKGPKKVRIHCLASHESINVDDDVIVREVGSEDWVEFVPNNTHQNAVLTVKSENPEFEISYRNADTGPSNDKLCVHSIVGIWEPMT